MTAPHTTTSPDDTTRKIDLNLTQIAAAALAAVTSAVVGSRLGAVGTLIGAAGASVITTVATAVYRASLERSRERVRSLARRTRPLPAHQERSELAQPAAANAPLGDERLTGSTDRRSQVWDLSRGFATLPWGAVIAGALSAFVLAMMVITGFEWASGETVGGNGEGTTVGRVVDNPPAPRNPAVSPAPSSSSETPSATSTETPTETTDASGTATTTPGSGTSVAQSPTTTSDPSASSEPIPPLIPTRLPGVSG